jgi:hypothetical protein
MKECAMGEYPVANGEDGTIRVIVCMQVISLRVEIRLELTYNIFDIINSTTRQSRVLCLTFSCLIKVIEN